MVTLRTTSQFRRSTRLLVGAAPLLFVALTGCPGNDVKNPSGTAAKNSTAPSLQQQQATNQAQAQGQQNAQQIIAAQHAQKVQALITKAEASYKSGVSNYNANHLDAARQDFDSAVDTMLSSGMDLKNDPQLSDEFDQLLSAINSLELVALKQGNGFSGKIEEAPLDAANEVTFPSDPALVGKIANELKTTQSDLPLVVNDYVAGWISYFSNSPAGHAHLVRSLERAGKYKTMISKILAEQGVPQDLIYLAVAESGFQPQAMNGGSGAGGMWQFMPQGGYGLERNGYFDERFDPQKSTVAYAKYMKILYNQFGDWYLAMAAYDWGPGRIQHAVAKTGYADYWELYRRNASLPTSPDPAFQKSSLSTPRCYDSQPHATFLINFTFLPARTTSSSTVSKIFQKTIARAGASTSSRTARPSIKSLHPCTSDPPTSPHSTA